MTELSRPRAGAQLNEENRLSASKAVLQEWKRRGPAPRVRWFRISQFYKLSSLKGFAQCRPENAVSAALAEKSWHRIIGVHDARPDFL